MKTHSLKTWPQYFQAVLEGRKTYEVRVNDREFSFGDEVILQEWDPNRDYEDLTLKKLKEPRGYTGRFLKFRIGYIFPIDIPNGRPKDERVVFSLLKEEP